MEYPDQIAKHAAPSNQLPQQPVAATASSEYSREQPTALHDPSAVPQTSRAHDTPRLPLSEAAIPSSDTPPTDRTNAPPTDRSTQYQAPAAGPYTSGNGVRPPGGNAHRKRHLNLLAFLLTALIALLIISGLGGWLLGNSAPSTNPGAASNALAGQTAIENVAAKFHTSVVEIASQTSQGSSLGSGVIIDKRGYIVTNNHVIANGTNTRVILFDNTKLPARIIGTDPVDDLAVVKINPPAHISVASIGDSSSLEVGESVLAIGNPLGITQTVTSGIVSALGRNVSEGSGHTIIGAIQTDAAINPGNSGGALVNLQDDLIGMPTLVPIDPEFKTPASGVGFAIPSNRIKFIVPQLINSGRVINSGRASLGVQVISVDQIIAAQAQLAVDHGALIVSTASNSPASQGGLRRGDVIVQVDQQPIADITDLQDALINKRPGDTVTVHVYRGSQQLTDTVKLGQLQIS
jgi:S1-C subfamily serine protease